MKGYQAMPPPAPTKLLFRAALGVLLLAASWGAGSGTADADITLDSSVRYGGWGFTSPRDASGIDRIGIDELDAGVTVPFLESSRLRCGFAYSSVSQSELSAHLLHRYGKLDIEGGISLGFENEDVSSVIPGLYAGIDALVGGRLGISVRGGTSVFLRPLLSLSSPDTDFDQNLLGLALYVSVKDAVIGISCETRSLVSETGSSSISRNRRTRAGLSIATDLPDFWLNSTTTFGSEMQDFTEGSVHDRVVALYVEEMLLFVTGSLELSTGVRCTVSYITLNDLASVSPPPAPSLSVSTGVRWKSSKTPARSDHF
jgi:hypothetical protein